MPTLKDSIELQRQGRLEEAESGYRAVLADEPGNTDAMFMLGVARRLRGDAVEAEQLFERVAQAHPKEGDVQLHLASVRYVNGKIEEARLGYARALELNPNLIGAHVGLGQLARDRGVDDEREHQRRHQRAGQQRVDHGAAVAQVLAHFLPEHGEDVVHVRLLCVGRTREARPAWFAAQAPADRTVGQPAGCRVAAFMRRVLLPNR